MNKTDVKAEYLATAEKMSSIRDEFIEEISRELIASGFTCEKGVRWGSPDVRLKLNGCQIRLLGHSF